MHPQLAEYLNGKIDIDPQYEDLITKCFIPRSTSRNEVLIKKGDIATTIFLVLKGCLRIFLTDDNGNQSTRFLIFEGKMGTAFPSFILQRPSAAWVQSVERSELLCLSYDDLQILYREIPGWETMHRKGIELDYIASIERIESLITLKSTQRYQLLTKSNPDINQRLPARIIADYLGISQETLSRLKSRN
jgi:CRP/FNR family cyclic AMP-dependent transcriptional regulator